MTLRSLQLRAKTSPVTPDEIAAVIAALPADEQMIHWSETGVPVKP